jgi:hypothetical protein
MLAVIILIVVGIVMFIDFNSEEKAMREFCKIECSSRQVKNNGTL